MYSHPKFVDVVMQVQRKFYIREKDMWSLKVQFFDLQGHCLCLPYRIKITNQKFKEFTFCSMV